MSSFFNDKNKQKNLIDSTNTKDDITTGDLINNTDNELDSFLNKSDEEIMATKNSKAKSSKSAEKDKLEWALSLRVVPLSIMTGLFFSGAVFSYITFEQIKSKNTQRDAYVLKVEKSLEKIEKNALTMRTSALKSLDSMSSEKSNIDSVLKVLEQGGSLTDEIPIDPLSGEAAAKLSSLKKSWLDTRKTIEGVVAQKDNIIKSKELIDLLNKQSASILNNTTKLQKVLEIKDGDNAAFLSEFTISVYRVLNQIANADSSVLTEEEKQYVFVALGNIASSLESLKQTYKNDAEDVTEVLKLFEESFSQHLDKGRVVENIVVLNNMNKFNTQIISQTNTSNTFLAEVTKSIKGEAITNSYLELASSILGALGAITLALISIALYARNLKTLRLANVFKKNQSNEKALVELLNQIQPLDEGDFTKPIFVEDKFLLNIAKRIDKTRIQFGDIVRQMKESSGNILSAAEFTDTTSQELLGISKRQFEKLAEAINVISDITNSIDEVAQTAWIAQDESNRSSQESEKGKQLVDQSIEKMNEIRNTIQESSKKIKKLGESAQSITEVTSLIKDITKQINILALNAAIQAASSGESGREFTVVAQEVQRLADDSEAATKKIEELINDIQSDTAVAIASMEKTTQEVVIGAQLTEQAGAALNEINNLSKNTAEQIMAASSKLEEKSSEMANVTVEMQGLQTISKEAQQAVNVTTAQVESLKKISEELEDTFKQYKV